RTTIHTPEAVINPWNMAADLEEYRSVAPHSRVVFYGEGPDNALLYEWKPYISYLVRNRRFARLLADIGMHMIRHRRIPLVSTVPRIVKDWMERDQWLLPFPDWLNASFASRMRLRQRWDDHAQRGARLPSHPVRPIAYWSFHTPLWEALFRRMDAQETAAPIEIRHPFLDLRVLRYMLAVPTIPWCRAKYLERRAMRTALPLSVLRRPKSPLKGEPYWE